MSTLQQLVDTVGDALVRVVAATGGLDREIRDVLVHDSSDAMELRPGDLLLGVGFGPDDDPVPLVKEIASADAAGLILKSHAIDDSLVESATSHGVALVAIAPGTSWGQVLGLMQTALRHGGFYAEPEELGELEAGDLFALSDALASVISAPITIEDRLSRVIAYSGGQADADAARAETIVGRKVPDRLVERLEEDGVFEQLERARGSVWVNSLEDDILPRLAVAVKAGPQLLGYVWAACKHKPTAADIEAFERAAQMAALHLLRHRAGADMERKIEADLLAAALAGGANSTNALARLGFAGKTFAVIAIGCAARLETAVLMQIRDVLAAELGVYRIQGRAAAVAENVYAFVESSEPHLRAVERATRGAVERIRDVLGIDVIVGISCVASDPADLTRARQEAETCLDVHRRGGTRDPVVKIDDVRTKALLVRLGELVGDEREVFVRPLAPLRDSDTQKGTSLVRSLAVYLEEFGDIQKASSRLQVHPNTLRYRIRRIEELTDIDLTDANDRLSLALTLAAFPEL